MDPEQLRLLQVAIKQKGAPAVLQAILKTHPELRGEILNLVGELGADVAVRVILQLPELEIITPSPTLQEAAPSGTAKEIGSIPTRKITKDIPQALSGLETRKRSVTEVGLGAPAPEKFQTSPRQRQIREAPTPSPIKVPEAQSVARQADRLAPGMEMELPTQQIQRRRPPEARGREIPAGETPVMEMPPADVPNIDEVLMQVGLQVGVIPAGITGPTTSDASLKSKWEKMGPNAKSFATLCSQHKIPMEVVLAIVRQESRFDPKAKSGVGAMGLMQLMPGTARDQGLKVTTKIDERSLPKKNLSAGLAYLSWLRSTYKTDTLDKLLAAYNAGPGRLKNDRWKRIPETNRYIDRIKKTLSIYKEDPGEFGKDLSSLLEHL